MKRNRLSYDSYELEGRDLVVFYYEEGVDECMDFIIKDFVPRHYTYKLVSEGSEEAVHDYTPQDWVEDFISNEKLCELVKQFEHGI